MYEPKKHADRILKHYIVLALREAGANVDRDTYAELDGLIQDTIEPLERQIGNLQAQIDELADGQGALEAETKRHDIRWKMLKDPDSDWPPEPPAGDIDGLIIMAILIVMAMAAVILLLWS